MLSRLFILLIRAYQVSLGRLLPQRCRFYPSCSQYAVEALRTNGAFRGLGQAAWRLMRCGPWTGGGYDPVPTRAGSAEVTSG